MSPGERLSTLTVYGKRVAEDEYIQEQLEAALHGLRRAARRAKGQSPGQALQNRRVRDQLSDVVRSLAAVCGAVQAPGRRRSHRVRRGVLVTVAIGGAIVAWEQFTRNSAGGSDGSE